MCRIGRLLKDFYFFMTRGGRTKRGDGSTGEKTLGGIETDGKSPGQTGAADARGRESAPEGLVQGVPESDAATADAAAVQERVRTQTDRALEASVVFTGIDFAGARVRDVLLGMFAAQHRGDIGSGSLKTTEGREVVKINALIRASGFSEDEFLRMFPRIDEILRRRRGPAFIRTALETLTVRRKDFPEGEDGDIQYKREHDAAVERTARISAVLPMPFTSNTNVGIPQIADLYGFAKSSYGTTMIEQTAPLFFKLGALQEWMSTRWRRDCATNGFDGMQGLVRVRKLTCPKTEGCPDEAAVAAAEELAAKRTFAVLQLLGEDFLSVKDLGAYFSCVHANHEDFEGALAETRKNANAEISALRSAAGWMSPGPAAGTAVGRREAVLPEKRGGVRAHAAPASPTRPAARAKAAESGERGQMAFFTTLQKIVDPAFFDFLARCSSFDRAMNHGTYDDNVPGANDTEKALFMGQLLDFRITSLLDGFTGALRIVEYCDTQGIKVPRDQELTFFDLLNSLRRYPDSVRFIAKWGMEFLLSGPSVLGKVLAVRDTKLSPKFFDSIGKREAFEIPEERIRFIGGMIASNDGKEEAFVDMYKAVGPERMAIASNLDIWAFYYYYQARGADGILENARAFLRENLSGIKDSTVLTEEGVFDDPEILAMHFLKHGKKKESSASAAAATTNVAGERPNKRPHAPIILTARFLGSENDNTDRDSYSEAELLKIFAQDGVDVGLSEDLLKRHAEGNVISHMDREALKKPFDRAAAVLASIKDLSFGVDILEIFGLETILRDPDLAKRIEIAKNGFGGGDAKDVRKEMLVYFLEFVREAGLDLPTEMLFSKVLVSSPDHFKEAMYVFEQPEKREVILGLGEKREGFVAMLITDIDLTRALSTFDFSKEDALLIDEHCVPGKVVAAIVNYFDKLSEAMPYVCRLVTNTAESPNWDDLDYVANDDPGFAIVLRRCVAADIPIETARILIFTHRDIVRS